MVAYHPVVVVAVGWIGIRYFVGSSRLLLPRIRGIIFRSPVFPVTRVLRWLCDCVVFCFALDCVSSYFGSAPGVLFSLCGVKFNYWGGFICGGLCSRLCRYVFMFLRMSLLIGLSFCSICSPQFRILRWYIGRVVSSGNASSIFAGAMLYTGQSLRPFLTIHPEGTSVSVQRFVCTERQY